MTDCEALIYGILVKNWSTAVARPIHLPINDDVKQRPIYYPHSIQVFEVDGTDNPLGLGYQNEQKTVRLTVDLQGEDRTLVLLQVAEIKRALKASRKNPGSTLDTPNTDFDLLRVENEVKQSGYYKYYHFTVDCFLRRTSVAI
jgi:hypothetical protein